MTQASLDLISTGLHWVVGLFLVVAIGFFVQQFLIPAVRVGRHLREAHRQLMALKAQGPVRDRAQVREQAMVSDALRHCWDEYCDTLHGQKRANAMGALEVERWRATSLANTFFTEQGVIDAPLRTEFYKHLPGILTGLGIIGTFFGLVVGLQAFQVSANPDEVRNSLKALISSVGSAFLLSGAAIVLAMLVTTIEKICINKRYTDLERLCGLVDSLFDAGAGEEYLQRLVEASETSATQAMQMKESLVTDLKQVLAELTQQQIAAMTTTSHQLGQSITTSLTEGLADPLARISNAVQHVGNSQGDAVNKLLTDVLSGFTAQMENMFGSQMRGMNDMLVQTANTIQLAAQQFEQLAGQIQQAGSGAADAMAQRMDEALQQMQVRQTEANDQMRHFIDQLKDNLVQGQTESAAVTMNMVRELGQSTEALVQSLRDQTQAARSDHSQQQTEATERLARFLEQMQASASRNQSETEDATRRLLGQLGDSASAMVTALQEQSHKSQQEHAVRQTEAAAKSDALMDRQSTQMGRLADAVEQASTAMQSAVDRLQARMQTSIDSMGQGAERLYGAASRLGDNLERMKASSDGLNNVAEQLGGSAATLSTALVATQQVLSDHKAVRDALAGVVNDLRTTIETGKREASLTASLVDSLQSASLRLAEAQVTADKYLQGVTAVLSEAHGAFAQQMTATLREGNRAFHEELAQATSLLKGAIQELGDTFDKLPAAA